MAHKVKISGTDYSISGGKTLINGTAYSIKNGKTLVEGTAHSISFNDTWEKWNINKVYAQQKVTQETWETYTHGAKVYYGGGYSFNSNNGLITLSLYDDAKPTVPVSNLGRMYYQKTHTPTTKLMHSQYGYYDEEDKVDYILSDYYITSYLSSQSKGTTSYGTVSAPPGTYPDNGPSGSYWYVKI